MNAAFGRCPDDATWRDFCTYLLRGRWATKMLAGHRLQDEAGWRAKFERFWEQYRSVDPQCPVFQDHGGSLGTCIPVLLHGDEGVGHRRRPVMQISFGPLLEVGKEALNRLFLLTTCPSKLCSKYNTGTAAVNPVIDRLLEEVARSMRSCYLAGVVTDVARFYIVCIGLSGDHIFQSKAFRCNRHHTRNAVCPLCLANTTDMPFEDVEVEDALWTRTVYTSLPWSRPPPLQGIPGATRPWFIQFDLMHVLPHGCGRTYIASVIAMMCGPLNLFRGNNKAERMHDAYTYFLAFCEAKHLFPRDMQEFTPENFAWKYNRNFPEIGCKAADCNMLFQRVIDFLSSTPPEWTEPLQWTYMGCCGFDDFCRLCYRSSDRVFWSRDEARKGYGYLRVFLRSYKALAFHWHKEGWTLYNIVPKMHFACHWLYSLHLFLQSEELWTINPGAFATPLMEDFIGVCSRIARTSHPTSVAITTIRKYLVETRRAWRSD